MRYLNHPRVEEITVEGILHALSDPDRVQIFMQLSESSCAQKCSSFIKPRGKPLAKSTLSQHFRILREAGLIRSEKDGVRLANTTRCAELQEKFGGMIEAIVRAYVSQACEGKKKRS